MDDFLELIDVQFMDHLTVPRQSLANTRRRRSSSGALSGPPTLGDYVMATALYVPMLEVYGRGVKDVQDKIDGLKAEFEQTNEDVRRVPPEVFTTYLESTEEDRKGMMVISPSHRSWAITNKWMFQGTIQNLKTDTRELAKSVWYDARSAWLDQLGPHIENGIADLDHVSWKCIL
jgi:hypothetical protein